MSDASIILPTTEDEAADAVKTLASAGAPIEIGGNFSKSGIGQPLNVEKKLSSAALTGIVEYQPSELVITAKAGTPLSHINDALSKAGQVLTFEAPDYRAIWGEKGEPTLGAIAAANLAGSRRYVSGAARDSLLGIRFINGEGDIIKNGGRVMKNVTGLDLVKLLSGSWGTLAFFTEVTFKVLPKPETERTLVLHGFDDGFAMKQLAKAMSTSAEVSGAAHLPELVSSKVCGGQLGDEAATLLRLEGFEESVAVRLERLKTALDLPPNISVLEEGDSANLWQALTNVEPFSQQREKPLWKVSMAPAQGWRMVDELRRQTGMTVFYDWQGGLIWAQMEADADADALRQAISVHGGGHATLYRGSEEMRSNVSVFQPQASAIEAVSKRIKSGFDPKNIFNPGRMGL